MICPKCNRKYDDDMPRCLWCDALNINYEMNVNKRQINEELKTDALKKNVESSKGTVIFLLTALGGECGLHLFMTGYYLRGFAYLFLGSFTYSLLCGFFGMFVFPLYFYFLAPAFVVTIRFLCFRDLWNICRGKFFNKKKKILYSSAKWMNVLLPFVGCVYLLISGFECVNQFANYSMIGQKRLKSIMQTYVDCQEKYFMLNRKIGTVDEINFDSIVDINSNYFTYNEITNGIEIENQTSYGSCQSHTKWRITANFEKKLNWKIDLPEEKFCKKIFPELKELKKKIQSP